MTYENILPAIRTAPWSTIEFPSSLVQGEQSIPCTVTMDQEGAIVKIKQGSIVLPRSAWALAIVNPEMLSLAVVGRDYNAWLKLLKSKAKNPDVSENESATQVVNWVFKLSPKKLGLEMFEKIQNHVRRSEIENYLVTQSAPDSVIITRCPTCSASMDITPYADNDSLYCNNCSRFLSPKLNVDDLDYGICESCNYYTKLRSQNSAKGTRDHSICFRCYAKSVWRSFLVSLAIAVGIGVLNVVTIVAADRFFPVLLIFAAVSFLWSIIKLISVIMVSMTRTATGVTPLEKATAAVKKGRVDEALKYVESLPDATSNPGVLLNMTRGLLNARDYRRALQFADLLVTQFPNFQHGYVARVEALAGSGALPEELAQAQQAQLEVFSRNMLKSFDQMQWITQLAS